MGLRAVRQSAPSARSYDPELAAQPATASEELTRVAYDLA